MNDLIVLCVSAGVFFFILEMFTGTFYGLSMSIAAFLLALFVYVTGDTSFTVTHAFIFAALSGIFSWISPKIFARFFPVEEESKWGNYLDEAKGKTFVLKGKDGNFKIVIDGVDYHVHDACVTEEFIAGKKVVFESSSGSLVTVSLLKK